MFQRASFLMVVAAAACGAAIFAPERAQAQAPVVVTTMMPAQPVVAYQPVRRGLFGRRLVYRPVVSYAIPVAPAPAAVTTYYAPAAPVTTMYAPAPVTTFYAPAPVVVERPVIAAPVRAYYPPAVPFVGY